MACVKLIASALVIVCVAACTRAGTAAGRFPGTTQGVLRVAIQNEPKTLNPLLTSNTTDAFVDFMLFEPLLSADDRGNPVPILAARVPTRENGGISRDGMTVRYDLRRNVKWSDGVPVTAKDVKWTWQAIMKPDNDIVSRHGYDYIQSIDTPDDYTVVVRLKQRFAPFISTFFAMSDQPYAVAPSHVLASEQNVNQTRFNGEPNVSDGPYRFAEWSRGDHITLVRNDGFFLAKPGLARIELRVVPDESTAVTLLKSHAIDYMFQASSDNYPQLKSVPGIRLVWVNVNGYEYVILNLARPPLNDPIVRRAIAYAIDRHQLTETLTHGQMKQAAGDIPDWMWASPHDVPDKPYDPAKARALLLADGYRPAADGVVAKNGTPLVVVLVSNNSSATRRQGTLEVQAMLRRVGIDAEIKYYPGQELFAPPGMGGILQLGKFDVAFSGWYAGIDPDDSTQMLCEDRPPGGYNYSRYCDPAMQVAQRKALTEYDRPSRKNAYRTVEKLLARDDPYIFLWQTRQMEPISTDLKGFDPNPVLESWNSWQWTI